MQDVHNNGLRRVKGKITKKITTHGNSFIYDAHIYKYKNINSYSNIVILYQSLRIKHLAVTKQ